MKAVRFVIPKTGGNSFRLQIDEGAWFYDTIHYHPEHQITFIIKGEGTSLIGNHVGRFQAGDVFFIGKNVPHVTRCDNTYYDPNSSLNTHSISMFFNDEAFGTQFFNIPEMAHVKRLLEQASMGIKIYNNDKQRISGLMLKSTKANGFERFQLLMNILNICAQSETKQTLSGIRYLSPTKESDNERINVVFNYLSANFREEISLAKISDVATMTPNAFCRYFKQRTGKSYTEFLNEMRIEFAGKQIALGQESFGNIAIDCGYNNISYFNRQFKRIMGLTPLQYRKKFKTA